MDILPPLSEEDRMISGLCYPFWLLVPPLVLLGSRREEPFVHFHALQAVALGAVSTVGTILLVGLVWAVMVILPGSNPMISGVVGVSVFALGFFLLFFYLTFLFYTAWRAASGRFLRLPFLGAWAEARMQAALGLTAEAYRSEPLEAPVREVRPESPEAEDPAELLRRHRPPTRAPFVAEAEEIQEAPPSRPRQLPRSLGPMEAAVPEEPDPPASFPTRIIPRSEIAAAARSAAPTPSPEPAPADPDDFQPGLFPPPRTGGRKFRWDPLDDEKSEDEPNGGFQAW